MQRIVFRADDERTEPGGGNDSVAAVTATRHVTLVFPATRAEYEQVRAAGERIVRRSDETFLGLVPTAPAGGADYVATTDAQRRARSLPDLTCAGREDDGAAVAVMAPCDAIRTLLGGDARVPDARPEGAVPPAGAEAVEGSARLSVTDIVNLKEGRGRIPPGSRQAFDELSRATQLDAARGKLGAAIELLERKTLPTLERSHHTIETLSQRPIRGYTREPGVTHLDRLVGAFARRVARLGRENGRWPGEVGPEALGAGIAEPPFREGEFADRTRRPGVAVALGVSPAGGRLGVVEARCFAGRGAVRITGTLGTTMRESASVALTWEREHAHRLDALALAFDWTDFHVHLPPGGRRQDGPSAGVTIVTAVVSVLTGQAVRPGVAMTGEITLSWRQAAAGWPRWLCRKPTRGT